MSASHLGHWHDIGRHCSRFYITVAVSRLVKQIFAIPMYSIHCDRDLTGRSMSDHGARGENA